MAKKKKTPARIDHSLKEPDATAPAVPPDRWPDPTFNDERVVFERSGDRFYVLAAITICFRQQTAVPAWAQEAFMRAFDTVNEAHAASWDEVFGKPHPKGVHIQRHRHWLEYSHQVHARVVELHAAGEPIDEQLFEIVGKEFHVGKTKASQYYYQWTRLIAVTEDLLNRNTQEN
jgi:hypothetical protein